MSMQSTYTAYLSKIHTNFDTSCEKVDTIDMFARPVDLFAFYRHDARMCRFSVHMNEMDEDASK